MQTQVAEPRGVATCDEANLTFTTETKLKVEAAATLRDSLDHYTQGQIYAPFLKKLMPIFVGILSGPCTFQSNSTEQVSAKSRGMRSWD